MTIALSPPKPVMTLRIGVTGHRQSRLPADQLNRIGDQIQMILTLAAEGLDKAHAQYADDYAGDERQLFFVSALADGADTLAARRAIGAGWRLLAPLPFSRASYARDFSVEDRDQFEALLNQADAVAELDGLRDAPANEERAYLQAGLVTVEQSDIIIAVWDGKDARGVGGTAMIKDEAMSLGKPVIWVNAAADTPPVFLSAENTVEPPLLEVVSPGSVLTVIDAVVAPPTSSDIEHAFSGEKTHALAAYRVFAEEGAHRFNYGSFFQFWEKLFAGKWPFSVSLICPTPVEEISDARQSTLAQKLQSSNHDQHIFNDLIIPRFAWADHLAVHYGNLYRSSYFFNYLFAAVAVFLALFDLVAGGLGFGSKTLWIGSEVVIIITILFVTTAGKRGRWHEKWIDYRQLAEELRQYRLYYLTLGRDAGSDLSKGEGGEAASWVDWYFAASCREAGMTSGTFDAASIRRIAETVLKEEITPQIAYHEKKAGTLHILEHRLHHLGEYAFGATLLVCLFYLGLVVFAGKEPGLATWAYETKNGAKGAVTMMTGFLPALGAAFFGVRVQGEFGSTAERSHATAAQLKTLAEKFEALSTAQTPRLEALRLRVEETARAMLMENMDWRMLYISKPLNLPG
jgi:Protein of unknown function (DUF4231)